MIEFIQDYTTKALPPEVFKKGQQVARSKESELYLVRLGVAGYVHDGQLVDQDFLPIVKRTIEVEVTGRGRRTLDVGGVSTIALVEPQRASPGPIAGVIVDDAMLAAPVDQTPSAVEIEQLRADHSALLQRLDDHQTSAQATFDDPTGSLTAVQGERETALADLATARTDLANANADKATLTTERDAAKADVVAKDARIAELEAALAAASKPADAATGKGK